MVANRPEHAAEELEGDRLTELVCQLATKDQCLAQCAQSLSKGADLV